MAAVWLVARAHLRRRWRSTVVVVLLAGLTGASVLAALAGARRTRSSVTRLHDATASPDAYISLPSNEQGQVDPELIKALGDLPEVDALAPAAVMFMLPDGTELASGRELSFVATTGTDDRLGRDVLRPRLIDGRRARPDRADEAVFNEVAAASLGVEVGDTVPFSSFTPAQVLQSDATGADPGAPAGPAVEVEVVGIGRSPADLFAGENFDNFPVLLTPALYERYRASIASVEGVVLVRLRSSADAATLPDSVAELTGKDLNIAVDGADEADGSLRQAIDTESVALLVFAAAVALAGLVAIAQALGRQSAGTGPDQAVLRALGASPAARLAVGLTGTLPIATAGAALAVVGAMAASPLLPFGIGGRAEPDPGPSFDPLVLGVGAVAVATVVLAVAGAVTWRAVRGAGAAGSADRARMSRRSLVARQLTRAGLPPAPDVGVRMALEAGRGSTAVPVRPALMGAVAGVAGIVAALVVGASLHRLVESPPRYGWNWDVAVTAGTDPDRAREVADNLGSDADVAAVATVATARVQVAGRGQTSIGLTNTRGSIEPTVIEGRAPRARDEIALGTKTLARAGRSIGDTVPVGPENRERELRIVGKVVLPALDTDEPDSGAVVAGGIERLRASGGSEVRQDVLVRFAPGVDHDAAIARLEPLGFGVITTRRPVDVDTLAEVDVVTIALAGVLAVLGVLAVAHALVTTVRRRRHDLAVLEALGFLRHQVRGAVAWQATVVASVGVAIGVPLGFLVGGRIWAALAAGIGVGTDPAFPVVAIALVAGLTVCVANVIAVGPARAAARIAPAAALRTE